MIPTHPLGSAQAGVDCLDPAFSLSLRNLICSASAALTCILFTPNLPPVRAVPLNLTQIHISHWLPSARPLFLQEPHMSRIHYHFPSFYPAFFPVFSMSKLALILYYAYQILRIVPSSYYYYMRVNNIISNRIAIIEF